MASDLIEQINACRDEWELCRLFAELYRDSKQWAAGVSRPNLETFVEYVARELPGRVIGKADLMGRVDCFNAYSEAVSKNPELKNRILRNLTKAHIAIPYTFGRQDQIAEILEDCEPFKTAKELREALRKRYPAKAPN